MNQTKEEFIVRSKTGNAVMSFDTQHRAEQYLVGRNSSLKLYKKITTEEEIEVIKEPA